MDKAQIASLGKDKLGRIAVAHLIKAKEERPGGLEKLFSKLEQYEISMGQIMTSMEEAKKQIASLQSSAEQLYGSISSVVELISDELPEDKIKEWCEKYEVPDGVIPGPRPQEKSVDMAGSTAKMGGAPPVPPAQNQP